MLLLMIGFCTVQMPSIGYTENADDRSYPPIMMILVDTSLSMGNRRDPHSNMYSAINAIVGDGTTAGVLPSYQYEVKFGFAGMAYGENGLYGRRLITNDDSLQEGVLITDLYKTKYKSGIVATQGYKMNLEWCENYYTDEDIKNCTVGPSTSINGDKWGVGYYTGGTNQTSNEFKACADNQVYWDKKDVEKVKESNQSVTGKYFRHKCAKGFNAHEVGTTYVGTRFVTGPNCMPGKLHEIGQCRTWCKKFRTDCKEYNKVEICDVVKKGECLERGDRWFCTHGSGDPCISRAQTYEWVYQLCTEDDCKTTATRTTNECAEYYAGCKKYNSYTVTDPCPGYYDPDQCKTYGTRNTTCKTWDCAKYDYDEHNNKYCKKWANTCKVWNTEQYCVETYGPNACKPPSTKTYKECVEYYDANTECKRYKTESYCAERYPPNTVACRGYKRYYYYCTSGNWRCDDNAWEKRNVCVREATTDTKVNCRKENTTCAIWYGTDTANGQVKECVAGQTTEIDQNDPDKCYTKWTYKQCDEYEKIPEEYTYVAGPYTYSPTCQEFACSDYHKENDQAVARLLYPTVSDDVEDIYNANSNINYYVNRYSGFADTPIGPALADLWYMFGCQSGTDCLYDDADPGLVKQKVNGTIMRDTHYQCRKKAAILVTDGEPCCNYPTDPSGHADGQSSAGLWFEDEPDNINKQSHGHYSVDSYEDEKNAWIDAYHLYKAGIPVYAVAYEMDGLDPSDVGGAGDLLNKIAFYGGTCKNPETMLLLNPEDGHAAGSEYAEMIAKGKKLDENGVEVDKTLADRICFYNAQDGDALRRALVTALSDMLQSTVSKTKVATTTSIGVANNIVDGVFNNGQYNIYSGYVMTNGPVRKSKLERTAIICNHDSGKFEYNENQYMDMAQRLACRLSDNCTISVKDDRTGFYESVADTDTRQSLNNREGCSNRGEDSVREFSLKNNCLRQRYIFSGSYASNRFALYPAITSLASENSAVGTVANAIRTNDSNEVLRTANFIAYNEHNNSSCNSDMTMEYGRPIVKTTTPCNNVDECSNYSNPSCVNGYCETYGSTVNYMLSPYECVQDVDCGMKKGVPNRCDFGRCVTNSKFYSPILDNDDIVRIGGQNRKKYNQCTTHNDCVANSFPGKIPGNTYVCHAGQCLPGTVNNCNIKQFIATIPLGTIEYATPTPVNPPRRNYNSKSYKEFSRSYWMRDTMMLVGANDGMLHAFILGDNIESNGYNNSSGRYAISDELKDGIDETNKPIINEGDELWSFIPKGVFTRLHNLIKFGPQNMVNATPVVADVQSPSLLKFNKHDGNSSKTIADTQWRTVVVGGFGGSTRGYYALDITDPAQPHVLWEIDHQFTLGDNINDYPSMIDATAVSDKDKNTNVLKNPDAIITSEMDKNNRQKLKNGKGYPFLLMGYSSSEPIITQMVTDNKGTVEPVVILAGGTTHSTDLTDAEFNRLHRDENDRVGKALYIVRLFPPEDDPSKLLVKAFYFDNRISGSPAVYPSNFNSVAQVVYVGDEKGALYRLNLMGLDQSKWGSYEKTDFEGGFKNEKPAFDPKNGICKKVGISSDNCIFEAITFKPAVSLYEHTAGGATVQVTFGTGRNTNLTVNDGIYNYVANFYDVMGVDSNSESSIYSFNRFAENDLTHDAQIYLFPRSSSDNISDSVVNDASLGYGKYSILTSDPAPGGSKFSPRQKMTGAPVTYNYISYFPSYTTNDDKDNECISGIASIWRIGGNNLSKTYIGSINELTSVQNKVSENSNAFNGNKIDLPDGSKVYGIEITDQMSCSGNSSSSVAAPQLIFQTGIEFADIASDNNSRIMRGSGNSKSPTIQSSVMNLPALKPTAHVISWASAYE